MEPQRHRDTEKGLGGGTLNLELKRTEGNEGNEDSE
jgi:hypothetical protein